MRTSGDLPKLHEPVGGRYACLNACVHQVLERRSNGSKPTFLTMASCTHTQLYGNVCALCGTVLRVPEERRHLIWDLDHTLVHCINTDFLLNACGPLALESCSAAPDVVHLPALGLVFKIRPGALDALDALSEHYTMHVNSMGGERYVRAVVDALDPLGNLFEGRITSRRTPRACPPDRKELPYGGRDTRSTVIVDDIPEVWGPHLHKRVVAISKYVYFPLSADEVSAFELGEDEAEDTGMLKSIAQALQSCEQHDDMQHSLEALRRNVLSRHVIGFDRDVGFERSMYVAAKMGATVCEGLTTKCRYYISDRPEDPVTKAAVARGVHVRPSSWLHWQRLAAAPRLGSNGTGV